jgi:membrane associated rhomboid family serine protease
VTYPPGQSIGPDGGPAAPAVCVRHPDRPTGLRCARCERPACPDCLREAAVGYQCVDCVNEGRRTVRRPVTISGGRQRTGRPVVVVTLIALNVAIFVLTVVQSGSIANNSKSALFNAWGLWPVAAASGGWWQFITSGFLHYGPIHIGLNMISLWIIGQSLEAALGRLRFTIVYFVSLIGGSVSAFLFADANGQTAGASGAVFGLMGGLLVVVHKLRLNPSSVITMIVINLALSFSIQGISWQDHLGGLVVGGVATAAMVYSPAKNRTYWQTGVVAAVLVILAVLIAVRTSQFPPLDCTYSTGNCVSR